MQWDTSQMIITHKKHGKKILLQGVFISLKRLIKNTGYLKWIQRS